MKQLQERVHWRVMETGTRGLCSRGRHYIEGAEFAAVAVSRRHKERGPDLADYGARYVEMAERYRQAAIATFRAHRERQ